MFFYSSKKKKQVHIECNSPSAFVTNCDSQQVAALEDEGFGGEGTGALDRACSEVITVLDACGGACVWGGCVWGGWAALA